MNIYFFYELLVINRRKVLKSFNREIKSKIKFYLKRSKYKYVYFLNEE